MAIDSSPSPTAERLSNLLAEWLLDVFDTLDLPVRTVNPELNESSLTQRGSTCQILLHRNGFRSPNRLRVGSLPSDAAVNIVRILEDMMSSGVLTISCLRTYAVHLFRITKPEADRQSGYRLYLPP